MAECKTVKSSIDLNSKLQASTERNDTFNDVLYLEIIGYLQDIFQVASPTNNYVIRENRVNVLLIRPLRTKIDNRYWL